MQDNVKTVVLGFYYPQDEQFLFWFFKNPLIANTFIILSMELRAFLLGTVRKIGLIYKSYYEENGRKLNNLSR